MQTILNEKEKRTNNLNRTITVSNLKIGDIVYLQKENRCKLDPVYNGPFSIAKINLPNAIITDAHNKQQEVHVSRLIK